MTLNEQRTDSTSSIEWTRIRNTDGTYRRGFTWNVITGCQHDCEWIMPNNQRAECYAKTIADKFVQHYPNGFSAYYWHPRRLDEPKKETAPAGIFPDSMSDLFGHWVQPDHLRAVLDVMRETPQHIYQALTKNAPGYRKLGYSELPVNMWAGVSSPPDHMLGTDLEDHQKGRYLHKALAVLSEIQEQRQIVTWMSFEPLSQDWANIVMQYPKALKWAVIGAASHGRTYYPPNEKHVRSLLDVLDDFGVKTFFKGNMKSLTWARDNWREQFPGDPVSAATVLPNAPPSAQMRMF